MGLMDKLKGIVNPDTIDDNYDDEYVFDEGDESTEFSYDDYQGQNNQQGGGYQQQQQPQQQRQQNQNQYPQSANNNMNNPQANNAVEINSANNLQLKLLTPERYDSARQIADHLLNRRTVVLNLEKMTKEDARRMIEFLSGVIYSISGGIRRIQNNTFILAPNNVDMSTEQQINQQVNRDIFNN